MSRRHFMSLLTCLTAGALAPPALAAPPLGGRPAAPIRGICFDLFTLFDPRAVVRVADGIVKGRGLALWNAWKTRQFEYAWLRAAAG
jgi:2-haloacid dehalogenase